MTDLVVVRQALLDPLLDRFQFVGSILGDHNMGLQRAVLLVELPDVEMMEPFHPVEGFDAPDETVQIEAGGSTFHQHPSRMRKHGDDLPQDVARDQQRQCGVDPNPVLSSPDDGGGSDQDSDRSQRVDKIVDEGRTDVERAATHRP